ncbi:MAG: hypothetical protein FJ245_09135 [Nitrospira sp.]|nr:hypothetical protein [Nitrospira sp.]
MASGAIETEVRQGNRRTRFVRPVAQELGVGVSVGPRESDRKAVWVVLRIRTVGDEAESSEVVVVRKGFRPVRLL